MTVPSKNTQIVAQGLARLTSAFITQPNVRAMLAVYLQPFQDIENALGAVLVGRFLSTAPVYTLPQTNSVFDAIGALVGQQRFGLSDADYKSILYLRVAVNRATGATPDWSKFGAILLQTAGGPVSYYDGGDAAFFFGVWDMELNPTIVSQTLSGAVPNGVYGLFAYSTWPDGNDFEWGSVYDGTAGQAGWSSFYQPSVGGLLVAGVGM